MNNSLSILYQPNNLFRMSSNLKLWTKFAKMLAEVSSINHPTFHWRLDIYLPRPHWVSVANCWRRAGPSGWRWRRDLPCLESRALPVSCRSDPGNVSQETLACCWSFLQGCSQHSKYPEPWCIPDTFPHDLTWLDDEHSHLSIEHHLRGPVPPGGHVLRQDSRVVVWGVAHPGQPEITDL